jgi:CheY-like chemotaxis protein
MSKKILIIDDEKELANVTALRLKNMGHEAKVAYSGIEGVYLATNEDFDLVITDFNMPDMNGEEVIDLVKIKKPSLPVAIFSVYHDDDSTIKAAVRKKAAGIVKKPIEVDNLQRLLQQVLF